MSEQRIMDEYNEVYSKSQINHIYAEFSRLKDDCYLEHAGTTLYSDIQIAKAFDELKGNVYGNPHGHNVSSKFSEDSIDQVRYLVLQHFNTTPEEYSLIFTSGATGALKMVAESFNYADNGVFMYLEDNHTSVLGMRQFAKNYQTLPHDIAFEVFNSSEYKSTEDSKNGNSLFVYSAQCNFSGTKFPLAWIEKIHDGVLNKLTGGISKWFCMLDAASFISSNKLDLSIFQPDFICVSFYKIFGYPTGLGALLVKNSSGFVLKKRYFGGGTVQMALHTEHVFRSALHERFEDGTIPFLSIVALRHGFETLKRLSLNIDLISKHSFNLAKYVHHSLLHMHHSNGNPVAALYHDTDFENITYQGCIVNFNLLRTNGQFVGYSEVSHMANLYRIHLRTGCMCNPGACHRHLKLSSSDVKQQFLAGHVCGDQRDLINGSPTGSIRISFGYMSTKKDADTFLRMIYECYVSKPIVRKIPANWKHFRKTVQHKFYNKSEPNNLIVSNNKINAFCDKSLNVDSNIENIFDNRNFSNNETAFLQNIYVYPIKSCAPFSVPKNWSLESTGLEYDRLWMIVNSAGVCLTQKNEPKLCLIKPNIRIKSGLLELHFLDKSPITVPLNTNSKLPNSEISLCQSKICGDRVQCFDCGDNVADWLCESLQRSDLRLVRQDSDHLRINRKGEQSQLSLANQAQLLLVNVASVKYLSNSIPNQQADNIDVSNLVSRFRANLIINSKTAFIENGCSQIKIGNHLFINKGPCTRCQMICIDQLTGEKTVEPLRTLSILTESKIRFGIYLALESSQSGSIATNDVVHYL